RQSQERKRAESIAEQAASQQADRQTDRQDEIHRDEKETVKEGGKAAKKKQWSMKNIFPYMQKYIDSESREELSNECSFIVICIYFLRTYGVAAAGSLSLTPLSPRPDGFTLGFLRGPNDPERRGRTGKEAIEAHAGTPASCENYTENIRTLSVRIQAYRHSPQAQYQAW
ncbi:hypothetical protein TRV_06261, partial [Trichophyton verrucosum HKI 0517]